MVEDRLKREAEWRIVNSYQYRSEWKQDTPDWVKKLYEKMIKRLELEYRGGEAE